jgi:hypothetical protein
VLTFDNMGPAWTSVRDGAREGRLRRSDAEVGEVAARWDDLVRYPGLDLTKDLGQDVKQVLPKEERNPTVRQHVLRDSLASSGRLYASLQVPNVPAPLEIAADLRSRQVVASTRIDAPREGRSRGRVSWLLRQLSSAPDGIVIEIKTNRRGYSLAAPLGQARATPGMLYPDPNREVRHFVLKRSGTQGSFIDSVMTTTKDFYAEVVQGLRAWKATPPKLKKHAEEEQVAELPATVQEAVEHASHEMEETIQEHSTSEGSRVSHAD